MTRNGPTIRALQETIDKLNRQQIDALETSVYLPMSTAQTREYAKRGERLADLRRDLVKLTEKQRMR